MPFPAFNQAGDLPPGIYQATLDEVKEQFGNGGTKRQLCTRRLLHIYSLAQRSGHLQRFILFGSYITAKPEPNDVDIILIMDDLFRLDTSPSETRGLFEHAIAQARYGASIFWVRPSLLLAETMDEFVAYWQIKRDGSKRGIVEVVP
jgi:hypothetical protein